MAVSPLPRNITMTSKHSKKSGKSTAKPSPSADWDFVEEILASPLAHTLYLSGPPGIGKTYTAYHSGLKGREVFSVSLTPETPAAELRGFWMPKGDQFVWTDGVFLAAMRKGARVVINEISHASHDVLAILVVDIELGFFLCLSANRVRTIA